MWNIIYCFYDETWTTTTTTYSDKLSEYILKYEKIFPFVFVCALLILYCCFFFSFDDDDDETEISRKNV